MNVFFLELWHDLRAKRLWPVAALLALGVVAIPAVMLKSSSGDEPAPVPPAQQSGSVKDLLPVQLASGKVDDSKLTTFDPKNPFKPGVKVSDRTAAIAKALNLSAGAGAIAGPSSGKSAGDTGTGGGGGGGGGGGTSTGSPTTSNPITVAPKKKTARFTYVIDVTFVKNGKVSKRKGLRRLSMLPSQDAPLLIFLGVSNDADSALFLVDSGLKTFGEGSCKPSKSECGVLRLGSGSEHEFTDADDNSYGIRIDEIRRVSVARAAKAARAAAKKAAKRASASSAKRRFSPPFLTDIETETTTRAGR